MAEPQRWGVAEPLDAARTPLPWPKRLLLTGPVGLGDLVLLAPLVQALHRAAPGTRIEMLARPAYAPLCTALGADAFHPLGAPDQPALDPRGFDTLLASTDIGPTVLGGIEALQAVPVRIGPAFARWQPRPWNHLVHTTRLGLPRHEALRNLRLLRPFGVTPAQQADALRAWQPLRVRPVALPADLPAQVVVLHPFSMGHAREWPLAHWVTLARTLAAAGTAVLFTGSAAEGERLAAGWPAAQRPAGVHDATGRLDLPQLMHLLAGARALVACSTGPLHLAAALGRPVIGLFAPHKGIGFDRWAALGEAAVNVQSQRVCPPWRRCQNGQCACIAALAPERIATALLGGAAQALAPWPRRAGLDPSSA